MSAQPRLTLDATSAPWTEVYRRLIEVVVPRPIALVSTVDKEGRTNLAPYSFFTVVSSNPPYLAFCPTRSARTGELKDTLKNVLATGEFVVAVVTEDIAEAVNQAAATLPSGQSEFDYAGLTPVAAERVRPPLVTESPVNIECDLVEVHTYGKEGGAGNLVVGRVLLVHVDASILDDKGRVLWDKLQAVGRMGGEEWVRTREVFSLKRPK